MTPLIINPSLWILWMDTGDGGAAGTVAVATSTENFQVIKCHCDPKVT